MIIRIWKVLPFNRPRFDLIPIVPTTYDPISIGSKLAEALLTPRNPEIVESVPSSHPHRRRHARQHQRANADLSSQRSKEVTHDSSSGFWEGWGRRLGLIGTGFTEQKPAGEQGHRDRDGPIGNDRQCTSSANAKSKTAPLPSPFGVRRLKNAIFDAVNAPASEIGIWPGYPSVLRQPNKRRIPRYEKMIRHPPDRQRHTLKVGEASDPTGHQHARCHQRQHANLSLPPPEKLAHDSCPFDRNGVTDFRLGRFAGLREEQEC